MSLDDLQTAISQFDDWQHPWTFHDAVAFRLSSTQKDQFETVWQAALDPAHWNSADMPQCAANAVAAVSRLFPQLGPAAIEAIVNAAAYQWK